MKINKIIFENQVAIKDEIKRNFEGLLIGGYLNQMKGFSQDFKNFKPYLNGENIKKIDWKLWAKTEKLYVREFDNESNTDLYFFIDNSLSMQKVYDENLSKFEYSVTIFGILTLFFLNRNDKVNLFFVNKSADLVEKKIANSSQLFEAIDHLIEVGLTNYSIFDYLNKLKIKSNSLSYLLSDFFYEDFANRLKILSSITEIHCLQIVSKYEYSPELLGKGLFIDNELDSRVSLDIKYISSKYREELINWSNNLEKFVLSIQGIYFFVKTDQDIKRFIVQYIQKLV